ncbi:hypothetical protein [Poriferisphaera sp. WC338]|uniref:hypothetical protein n=1 Tax=Poriferisphaera sp. WC338 TaxID=3425129 RepID=UPI003D814EE4
MWTLVRRVFKRRQSDTGGYCLQTVCRIHASDAATIDRLYDVLHDDHRSWSKENEAGGYRTAITISESDIFDDHLIAMVGILEQIDLFQTQQGMVIEGLHFDTAVWTHRMPTSIVGKCLILDIATIKRLAESCATYETTVYHTG